MRKRVIITPPLIAFACWLYLLLQKNPAVVMPSLFIIYWLFYVIKKTTNEALREIDRELTEDKANN